MKNLIMFFTILGSNQPLSVIAAEPEIVPVPESIRERVSTSTEGLVEEFAISGKMVRLNGRFQSTATASLDKNGKAVVKCDNITLDLDSHN